MNKLSTLALAASAIVAAAAAPASAQQALVSNSPSLCIAGSGGALTSCTPGANQFSRQLQSGRNAWVIHSSNGGCLDGYRGKGQALSAPQCDGTADQDWFMNAYGQIQNKGNQMCVDVEGGNMSQGARVILWDCNGGSNQKFAVGTVRPQSSLPANVPVLQGNLSSLSINSAGIISRDGAGVITAGGGNVITLGGGN